MLKKILKFLSMLMFPLDCPFCERIMDFREDFVCKECLQSLPFIYGKRCEKCGRQIFENEIYCKECNTNKHVYKEGRAVFRYENPVSDAIIRFKYHGRRDYTKVFVFWLCKVLRGWIEEKGIDIILPVPIHRKRLRSRGYNQTELLAQGMAEQLGLVCNTSSVIRNKNTKPQKKLGVIKRLDNMYEAFRCTDDSLKGKKVLIIDDIYTTGMTVNILSACVLEAGAKEVYFASLSQGVQ